MSKIVCLSCGAWMEDTNDKCESCGAINPNKKVKDDSVPKNMVELKSWYDQNITTNGGRYCIFGEEINKPNAVGIVRKNSGFLVYKNNFGGATTAIYEGNDEEHAVEVVYLELLKKLSESKEVYNSIVQTQIQNNETLEIATLLVFLILVEWIAILFM